MVEVRKLAGDEWTLYKTIRLAALSDAPYAFGSTYEREMAFPPETWQERAGQGAEGAASICVIALDGDRGVGIAGGITPTDQPRVSQLVSMWVDPDYRGTDIASRLVAQIEVWAFDRGSERIILGVTEGNARAARFYEKLGFTPWDGTLEGEDCITLLQKPLSIA